MDEGLLVAVHDERALVCVRGRATFKVAPALRKFAAAALDQGATGIVLDMARCESMDSTFMGVLAGLALRLRKAGGGAVSVVNLTPRTRSLLEQLGLDQLLDCMDPVRAREIVREILPQADLESLGTEAADERATLDTMLDAHQDLVDACPDNLVKFTDVITYLKQAQKDVSD